MLHRCYISNGGVNISNPLTYTSKMETAILRLFLMYKSYIVLRFFVLGSGYLYTTNLCYLFFFYVQVSIPNFRILELVYKY
jgi:hypothetical protein